MAGNCGPPPRRRSVTADVTYTLGVDFAADGDSATVYAVIGQNRRVDVVRIVREGR